MSKAKLSPKILGYVIEIRALLSFDDKWTQHWFARDKNGSSCDAGNKNAVCWCISGAFQKVSGKSFSSTEFNEFSKLFPNQAVSIWNDSQKSYNAVAKRLDEIIRENT